MTYHPDICRWCGQEIYPRVNAKSKTEWLTFTGSDRTTRLTCTSSSTLGPHAPTPPKGHP